MPGGGRPTGVAATGARGRCHGGEVSGGKLPDLLVPLRTGGAERFGEVPAEKRRQKAVNGRNKKKPLDPGALGLWEGCDGAWYSHAGRCAVCGRGAGDHIAAGGARSKSERPAADALRRPLRAVASLPAIAGRLRVVFTRGYRGTPLDHDNLVGGFKPLRDEIARVLGRDDAEHLGIAWEYRQQPGAVCKVEIYEETEKVNE